MYGGSVGTFWWLTSLMKRGWMVYIASTQKANVTHFWSISVAPIVKLDGTNQYKNMNVRNLGGPTGTTRWDRCARAWGKLHLGGAGCINSVRPKWSNKQQRICQANSVTPIATSRWEQKICNKSQGVCKAISVRPRSVSVRPNCLGFLAVAMSTELGGTG